MRCPICDSDPSEGLKPIKLGTRETQEYVCSDCKEAIFDISNFWFWRDGDVESSEILDIEEMAGDPEDSFGPPGVRHSSDEDDLPAFYRDALK